MRILIIAFIFSWCMGTQLGYAKFGWFKSSAKSEVETISSKNSETKKSSEEIGTEQAMAINPSQLVIADFDTGDKPNNLGGDFGSWNKDPEDPTQSCLISFETDDALRDPAGYALKIEYDVESANPAYNGVWMKLNGQNASDYSILSFYVRGEGLNNYTKRIKIELKDSAKNTSSYLVSGITESWQKISIPFDRFKKVKDWNSLDEFVVVFDDRTSQPKQGALLIDQIAFEKK